MGKRKVWGTCDVAFALFGERSAAACRRAKRILLRLDAAHGGRLLDRSAGSNRGFTVPAARLKRMAPDLFAADPADLELRVEALEVALDERLDEIIAQNRALAQTVAWHSRELARLQSQRSVRRVA